MKKYSNIIQSETAPDTNSLWLKDGKLLQFNNGEWIMVAGGGSASGSVYHDMNLDFNNDFQV